MPAANVGLPACLHSGVLCRKPPACPAPPGHPLSRNLPLRSNLLTHPAGPPPLQVQFKEFKLLGLFPVKAPPSAAGELDITYLDDELRISRGNRNNLFVLRMRVRGRGGQVPAVHRPTSDNLLCVRGWMIGPGLAWPAGGCSVLLVPRLALLSRLPNDPPTPQNRNVKP